MDLAMIGTGYVGLVAAACFADSGNEVICVDVDQQKIADLKLGKLPIYEPGLEDLVARNTRAGRLSFTTSVEAAVQASEVIFFAVGTPQDDDGGADLAHIISEARTFGKEMNGPKIIVNKSTVPVGTAVLVEREIRALTSHPVEVISNPEFLKEGAAIEDFLRPDRVVVGVASESAGRVMTELYSPFMRTNNRMLVMDVPSAEMTKYAGNAMLAARISLMNEISQLCDHYGADVDQVRRGVGSDARIGSSFLFPGIGYGGSCLAKDVQALIHMGHTKQVDMGLSEAVEQVNHRQKRVLAEKVVEHFGEDLGKHVFAVWGLAFKPRTDDTREAPALSLVQELVRRGAGVRAFDPVANESFKARFGEHPRVTYCENNYQALEGADGLIVCTEWNDFRRPNFQRMKTLLKSPTIFDGRNIFSREEMSKLEMTYFSIGRPPIRSR